MYPIYQSSSFKGVFVANRAPFLGFEPFVDALVVVLVIALQFLVPAACCEFLKANIAGVFLGSALQPHLRPYCVDLLLRVAPVHVASSTFLQIQELLVVHIIDVGTVRVAGLLRLFNCALQQSLLLGLSRHDSATAGHHLHQHAAFGHPLLDLLHGNRHLHLSKVVPHLSGSLPFLLLLLAATLVLRTPPRSVSLVPILTHAARLDLKSYDLTLKLGVLFFEFCIVFLVRSQIFVFLGKLIFQCLDLSAGLLQLGFVRL